MTKSKTPITDMINLLTIIREQHGEIPIYLRDDERYYGRFSKEVRVLGSENCGFITIQEDVAVNEPFSNFIPTEEFPKPTKALLLN